MTKHKKTRSFLTLLTTALLAASPSVLQAETAPDAQAASGGVLLYGQTLHPEQVKFQSSDYTWKDLRGLVPKLLPDAQKTQLSAEQTCDHIVQMTKLYLIEVDEVSNGLAFKLGQHIKNIEDPDLELSNKLTSRSPKALLELLQWLPDDQSQTIMAKDLTLKSLAMILVHDAALANCPEYAKEKEYYPIESYDGPYSETPAPSEESDQTELQKEE